MKYTVEFSIDSFEFWDGAKDVVDIARKANKLDKLQEIIEELVGHYYSMPSKAEVNAFVWFNRSLILKSIGISDDGI